MTPELRTRIATTLRWLIADAQYRYNDCKQNLEPGSGGGYSPELEDASKLLALLEKPSLFDPSESQGLCMTYTLDDCRAEATRVGLTEHETLVFYHHFNAQDWVQTNKLPITNLNSAMFKWKMRQHEFEDDDYPAPPEQPRTGKTARELDMEAHGEIE